MRVSPRATSVDFGTVAGSVTADSATSITVTSPVHGAGTVDITVTTPNGTSASGSADHFTYVAAPTVTAVSPTAGPTSGGTAVTVTGTNLSGASSVTFGAFRRNRDRRLGHVDHRDVARR